MAWIWSLFNTPRIYLTVWQEIVISVVLVCLVASAATFAFFVACRKR